MQQNLLSLVGFVTVCCLMAAPSQSALLAMHEFQRQAKDETFFGTILRNGDNFVLSDSATKSRYTLDNAQMASRYEGITVQVTGRLDAASNSIHVETIKPVANRFNRTAFGPSMPLISRRHYYDWYMICCDHPGKLVGGVSNERIVLSDGHSLSSGGDFDSVVRPDEMGVRHHH
jgi:hypothetical protein